MGSHRPLTPATHPWHVSTACDLAWSSYNWLRKEVWSSPSEPQQLSAAWGCRRQHACLVLSRCTRDALASAALAAAILVRVHAAGADAGVDVGHAEDGQRVDPGAGNAGLAIAAWRRRASAVAEIDIVSRACAEQTMLSCSVTCLIRVPMRGIPVTCSALSKQLSSFWTRCGPHSSRGCPGPPGWPHRSRTRRSWVKGSNRARGCPRGPPRDSSLVHTAHA